MSSRLQAKSRLLGALEAAGLSAHVVVEEGTAGIASPVRLATEWGRFYRQRTVGPVLRQSLA